MPIFKTDGKVLYYAHVPKCGGSSVNRYLNDRFGAAAFVVSKFNQQAAAHRWSKTSPQHVDAATLARLFPAGFFDASFTIVRHPVARLVSAYHFHKEVERTIPEPCSFSEWLEDLEARHAADPFYLDNHTRPMADIVPNEAVVFHLELGLAPLIGWLDALLGKSGGPRDIAEVNKRGAHGAPTTPRVTPTEADLALIARRYDADFRRFGYRIDQKLPVGGAVPLRPAAAPIRPAWRLGHELTGVLRRLRGH